MKLPGQSVNGEGRRARTCVRRATEFDPLGRIEALPGRLLPPHPTVPRTVGLRTPCPRTTARGLRRPQIRLSKGRGSGVQRSVALKLLPLGATGRRSLAVAPRHQARRRRTRRGLDPLGTGAACAAGLAARVSGRYRQAETSRLGARSAHHATAGRYAASEGRPTTGEERFLLSGRCPDAILFSS